MTMNEQKTIETKSSFGDFIRSTRAEVAKVVWPTRKETLATTGMIVAMALLTGLFFFAIDSALGFVISRVLGMNS